MCKCMLQYLTFESCFPLTGRWRTDAGDRAGDKLADCRVDQPKPAADTGHPEKIWIWLLNHTELRQQCKAMLGIVLQLSSLLQLM